MSAFDMAPDTKVAAQGGMLFQSKAGWADKGEYCTRHHQLKAPNELASLPWYTALTELNCLQGHCRPVARRPTTLRPVGPGTVEQWNSYGLNQYGLGTESFVEGAGQPVYQQHRQDLRPLRTKSSFTHPSCRIDLDLRELVAFLDAVLKSAPTHRFCRDLELALAQAQRADPKGTARLQVTHWTCQSCGIARDRNCNAATSILVKGLLEITGGRRSHCLK